MRLPLKLAIDHYLGGSIAWLLNVACQLLSKVMTRDHSLRQAPRAVLFMKFLGLGSIARSAFLFPALKTRFPDAKIYFATFQGCAPLAKMYPEIDRVLTVRDASLLTLGVDTVRILMFAWRNQIDLVIDLEVHSKYSSVVSGLIAARDRAGFAGITSRFRRGLYTHLVFWNPVRSIGHAYRQLGEALGLHSSDLLHSPKIPAGAELEADAFVETICSAGETILLGVNPNASDLRTERRWPIQSFAQVINSLPADPRLAVFIVGSPAERSYCQELVNLCASARVKVHNAAGSVSFPGFAALIKRFTLFLTNDSGPLHLAAVLGAPTISLWGPTHPAVYSPRGAKHISLYRPIYCSPCTHASDVPPCGGDNQCLKQLEWTKVHRAVCRALGLTIGGPAEETPADYGSSTLNDGNIIYGYWRRPEVPPPVESGETAANSQNTKVRG